MLYLSCPPCWITRQKILPGIMYLMTVEQKANAALWQVLFFILYDVLSSFSPDKFGESSDFVTDDPTMKQVVLGYIVSVAQWETYMSICLYRTFLTNYIQEKWTRRHEFKSWTRLIAFSHSTNTLGKGMNPIILPPAMGK